ncbi:hypothetical protein E2562_038572 [Oryza meyeriana var. granulata]|uniref:Uncharacterized protein n=1 Tax=Oryza meyeriana var. granulata TaxID=110450 RepID=A0A6G1FGM7_9ORYZ|nr:hypothetical protein E2562_038572 [Oryza meyeriana var. granulata]
MTAPGATPASNTPRPAHAAIDPSRACERCSRARNEPNLAVRQHQPRTLSPAYKRKPPRTRDAGPFSYVSSRVAAACVADTTVRSETGGAASVVVVDAPPMATPQWRLRRQRSVPAAVVATFAPCVGAGAGGGHQAPRVLRLGGSTKSVCYYQHGHDVRNGRGEEEEADYFDSGGGGYRASSAARSGGVGVLRALWRRIVRGRRWKVMSRSGSSSVREQYAQEEYEQNFDEGAAAGGEPQVEYLSRSFSARYAGGGRRSTGLALWGVAR